MNKENCEDPVLSQLVKQAQQLMAKEKGSYSFSKAAETWLPQQKDPKNENQRFLFLTINGVQPGVEMVMPDDSDPNSRWLQQQGPWEAEPPSLQIWEPLLSDYMCPKQWSGQIIKTSPSSKKLHSLSLGVVEQGLF